MKVFLLFINLIVFAVFSFSCKSKSVDTKIILDSVDTLDAFFVQFKFSGYDDTILERFEMKVVRSVRDDTVYFEYINALDSFNDQTVKVPNNNVPLIIDDRLKNDQWFKLTDSFDIIFIDIPTRFYKYELMNAVIDGSTSRIISKDFGLIGDSYTSWGKGYILRKFGDIEIDSATINYLLDNDNKIFRD